MGELLIEYCLQALLSHSTISEQCQVIVESLTLPLLTLVIEAYPDNARIKSIIGKIISNISLHPQYHRAVFQSGWVGLLAEWKQHPSLLVSLPATKALCNLDQEFGGHKYEPGIYLMLPNDRHVQHKNNRSNWGVDVVFVHGLMGGVFYTWRQFDPENVREFSNDQISEDNYSYCWPRDWLAEDSNNVRVIGCDFDSYISQWGGSCPTQNFKQSLAERSEVLPPAAADPRRVQEQGADPAVPRHPRQAAGRLAPGPRVHQILHQRGPGQLPPQQRGGGLRQRHQLRVPPGVSPHPQHPQAED